MIKDIIRASDFLKDKGVAAPEIGIVLGTGLGRLVSEIDVIANIPYSEIPGFPESTVEFHKGRLIYGTIGNTKVLAMQGRLHYYEGYSMHEIVFPLRTMSMLGIKQLLLSNASGGIKKGLKKGDLMLIDDHINLQSGNPLIGRNLDILGDRFPDMSEPYSRMMNEKLIEISIRQKVKLKTGVYAAVNGPNLETRAEYRYLGVIGADIVGMSSVPEVIAANHMKLPCAAISVITDECDPDHLKPVNISEIIDVAQKADEKLTNIFVEYIKGYIPQ